MRTQVLETTFEVRVPVPLVRLGCDQPRSNVVCRSGWCCRSSLRDAFRPAKLHAC